MSKGFHEPRDLEPFETLAERAPLPVAFAMEQFLEGLSVRKPLFRHVLFDLCLAVESLLRFICAAAVVELAGLHGGAVPDAMRRPLRSLIEVPTLGAWREILRALSTSRFYRSRLMPEFSATARAFLDLSNGSATVTGDAATDEPRSDRDIVKVRNAVAHGSGISDAQARDACEAWMRPLGEFARQAAWLTELQLWTGGDDGTRARLLRGAGVRGVVELPPAVLAGPPLSGSAVALCRPALQAAIWLAPIQRWAPSGQQTGEMVLHTFARLGNVGLLYNLIGAVGALQVEGPAEDRRLFDDLFELEGTASNPSPSSAQVPGFEREVLQDARRPGSFVGRREEWECLREAVRTTSTGVLWVWGVAGVGKSALVTRLAATLLGENAPEGASEQTPLTVLVYRFRDGDFRCDRLRFLTWLRERTVATGTAVEEPQTSISALISAIREQLAARDDSRLTVIIDGLDELTQREPQFLTQELPALVEAGRGRTVWVVASRDEAPIRETMTAIGAVSVFDKGLCPLDGNSVRVLIDANSSHQAVRTLLRHDVESDGGITNRYIDRLAERSEGLPHYLRLVLSDIARGHLTLSDLLEADRLPKGIERYFTQLCSRDGLGDSATVPSLVVALLALTGEALSVAELAALVNRTDGHNGSSADAGIQAAIQGLMGLLKPSFTTSGVPGYRLFHLEFEHFVRSDRSWQITRAMARELLIAAARAPGSGADADLLYRRGVSLLIAEGRFSHARDLLCDPRYQVERLARRAGAGDAGMINDWFALSEQEPPHDADARAWCAFWLIDGYKLRSASTDRDGVADWLLATSVYPPDSPIGRAYDAIVEDYQQSVPRLEIAGGSRTKREAALQASLSGHEDVVVGARELRDHRLLSWSADRKLRIWDRDGRSLRVLVGHADVVTGADELSDGRLLSRSKDGTLRLWSPDGRPLGVMLGHQTEIEDVRVLSDGRFLSWAGPTLRLWDATGQPLAELVGHEENIRGARELASKRLVSWDMKTARLWSPEGSLLVTHSDGELLFMPPRELPGGNILFWTSKRRLIRDAAGRVLQETTGDFGHAGYELPDGNVLAARVMEDGVRILTAEGEPIRESRLPCIADGGHILPLRNGHLLFWSEWDAPVVFLSARGEFLRRLPSGQICGALEMASGHFITNPNVEPAPVIWSPEGERIVELTNGSAAICQLSDGRLLSRRREVLELWSADPQALFARRNPVSQYWDGGYQVSQLRSGELFCSGGDTMWLLSATGDVRAELDATGSDDLVVGRFLELEDGRLLSWSWEHSLLLWSIAGVRERQLSGHRNAVWRARQLRDGRLLSWSLDGEMRLWSHEGEPLRTIPGGGDDVFGGLELRDGRILAWTSAAHGKIRIWSPQGDPVGELSGHGHRVHGVEELSDGRLLSWSADKTLRLWSPEGDCLRTLNGHTSAVDGAYPLSDGRILSWAGWDQDARTEDDTTRLWTSDGDPIAVIRDDAAVKSVRELAEGMLLLGDGRGYLIRTADGRWYGTHSADGMMHLAARRFLCWKKDILQVITVDVDTNTYAIEREWRPGPVQACFPPRPDAPWWTVVVLSETRSVQVFKLVAEPA